MCKTDGKLKFSDHRKAAEFLEVKHRPSDKSEVFAVVSSCAVSCSSSLETCNSPVTNTSFL